MEDKIQSYRQPLVTATGIILGFILNFASSFVKADSGISDFLSYTIAISILFGVSISFFGVMIDMFSHFMSWSELIN